MSKWLWRVVAVAVLAGLVFWGWRVLFPHPERVIRKRLTELARTASFSGGEGNFVKVAKAEAITGFCTPDVEITVDIPGYARYEIHGSGELLQAAAAARTYRDGVKVQFFDIVVNVAADQKSAVAELTAKVEAPRERDFSVQELRFKLKKVERSWLISQVETVHTLSR
jgi:hypothetical protein